MVNFSFLRAVFVFKKKKPKELLQHDRGLTSIQNLAMRIRSTQKTGTKQVYRLLLLQYLVTFSQHLLGHGRRKKRGIDRQL